MFVQVGHQFGTMDLTRPSLGAALTSRPWTCSANKAQPAVPHPHDRSHRENEIDHTKHEEFHGRSAAIVEPSAEHAAHDQLGDEQTREDRARRKAERHASQHTETEEALGGGQEHLAHLPVIERQRSRAPGTDGIRDRQAPDQQGPLIDLG